MPKLPHRLRIPKAGDYTLDLIKRRPDLFLDIDDDVDFPPPRWWKPSEVRQWLLWKRGKGHWRFHPHASSNMASRSQKRALRSARNTLS
ncbi:hypothetical protein LCGC14_1258370 [marine sediment metagenome]|uniref:Uncharacterized protein n=1 Tax=marine sediment metagenome TaxID=412755 RepID=A0A0F9P4S3_9ZZZZ